MIIDWSLRASDIFMLVGGIATVIFGYAKINTSMAMLKSDFSHIKVSVDVMAKTMEGFGTVLTQIAMQELRLSTIQQTVTELRHGEGLVGVHMCKDKENG